MYGRAARRMGMTSDQNPETPEARFARLGTWIDTLNTAYFALVEKHEALHPLDIEEALCLEYRIDRVAARTDRALATWDRIGSEVAR